MDSSTYYFYYEYIVVWNPNFAHRVIKLSTKRIIYIKQRFIGNFKTKHANKTVVFYKFRIIFSTKRTYGAKKELSPRLYWKMTKHNNLETWNKVASYSSGIQTKLWVTYLFFPSLALFHKYIPRVYFLVNNSDFNY